VSGRAKARSLVLSVACVVALLIFVSRWATRVGDAPRPGAGSSAADAGGPARAAAEPVPDLSFYRMLDAPHAPGFEGPAPPPSPPPAPSAAPAARPGAYIVQVFAGRELAAARHLRDRLAARGLPAMLGESGSGATRLYRVRVGPYRERAAAETAARRVREQGLKPWVAREAPR